MSAEDRGALRRDDARARRDAQRVFDRPLVLEAGAGTGKTTTLVARVLAWSLGPGWERAREARADDPRPDAGSPERLAAHVLRRVVAITFTEAAAAEMSGRVGRALLAVERGETPEGWQPEGVAAQPEVRRARARALRGALDHLVAQTIHAYCRRLLVTHPLDAGLHPQLEIDADQRLQSDVVREVLDEVLRDAYAAPGDPDLLALAVRGAGPREIEDELLALLAEGLDAAALDPDPLGPQPVAALAARLARALDALAEAAGGRLEGVRGTSVPGQIAERARALRAALDASPPDPAVALARLIERVREQWSDGHRKRLVEWSRGRFGAREADALGDRAARIAGPARDLAGLIEQIASLDPEQLAAARRVFRRLLLACERRLRERGIATFSALLDGAARLLRECPLVAARVRAGIDQLLVDEFQDTDARQCDIVRAIALAGPREGCPGLFVVGDPKQSIYGWRSADLAAYDAFVGDVCRAGGALLRLSVNYRSAPAILAEVERVIEPAMRERRGVQPGFQPLAAHPDNAAPFTAGRAAPVEYWISGDWDAATREPAPTRAARAARIEAEALARDLRTLHDEHGVAWSSFGVLFRSRGDWELYLRALRGANVPFAVEGDRHYYRRREIVDATALVCCVLDPNDAVALLALLRSAAVGVPDAALIPLWARRFPEHVSRLRGSGAGLDALRALVAEVARDLPPDVPGLERVRGWEHALQAALEALARLRERYPQLAADVFVEELRRAFLLEASEAARYAGVWRVANLDRFFRNLAAQLDADGAGPVLRRLRRALADELQEEEGRPVEIIDDAVRILTIHGAKGLDFEHVYLMQLHKGRGGVDEARVGGSAGELGYRLLGAQSLDWDRHRGARAQVEEAERVRLLYVAMTRAKRRLVLAGLWPEFQLRSAGGDQAVSLLAGRRDGVPDLAEGMRASADAAGAGADEAGARWVFPALVAPAPPDGDPVARPDVALASPERVRADSAALARARAAAASRSARPFGGGASTLAHEEGAEERAERGYGAHRPAARDSPGPRSAGDGERARAVGTALHRALELCDLAAEPDVQREQLRSRIERELTRSLAGGELARAREDARELLEHFVQGPLLVRLRILARCVVARELPVIAAPDAGEGPVGFVSGAIDLVYRDPESDELVIADYKTDRLAGDAAMAERSRAHARQGQVYQRALRDALDLAYTPRFELWYLRHDRIETPGAA